MRCRYAATYGVRLDPSTQALSLIGSQEGLAHLLMAVTDPGDSILMLDVAYPSYFGAIQIAQLVPTYIPCDRETWLPDWSQVSPAAAQRCTCLLLNYPNNPTGVVVGQNFWREVLVFCEQHDLLLIHDNPYQSQVRGNGTRRERTVTSAGPRAGDCTFLKLVLSPASSAAAGCSNEGQ